MQSALLAGIFAVEGFKVSRKDAKRKTKEAK